MVLFLPEKKFSVGRRKLFSLEIKPRKPTGLIFAVVNEDLPKNGDYLVVELSNGAVSWFL